MKTTTHHYGIFAPSLIFLLLLHITIQVEAQTGWGPTRNTNQYPYSRFRSSLAIIIAMLVTSLFFMVFFFIYIRYCTAPTSTVPQPVALRSVVARGLDASVIETFPTFSYSEVKDHKIGKGALECAVCLNEFEDDETLRLIPKCDHVFHPECIDAWLESHVTCPVCRADLVPQPADCQVQIPGPTDSIDECCNDDGDNNERMNSRDDDIVIQVDDIDNGLHERTSMVSRNLSFQYPNRPPKAVVNRNLSFGNLNRPPISRPMNRNMSFGNTNRMVRSWSMRPRMFGLGKLARSRSAGNILVQPGEDLERFTLRLPSEVRKEVINRATLNRTRSFAPTSGWKDRADNIGRSKREVKSDRWEFFTRALSMKLRSTKGVAETGESSGSTPNGAGSRTLNKLRSFNCLVLRAADETGLISDEPVEPTA